MTIQNNFFGKYQDSLRFWKTKPFKCQKFELSAFLGGFAHQIPDKSQICFPFVEIPEKGYSDIIGAITLAQAYDSNMFE